MAGEGKRPASATNRLVLTALLCTLAASCSSTSDGDQLFGFTPVSSARVSSGSDFSRPTVNSAATTAPVFETDEDDPTLPREMAALPLVRPGAADAAVAAAPEAASPAEAPAASAEAALDSVPGDVAAAEAPATEVAAAQGADGPAAPAESAEAAPAAPAQDEAPRGFLAAFFSPAPQAPAQAAIQPAPAAATTAASPQAAQAPATAPLVRQEASRPLVTLASTPQQSRAPAARSSLLGSDALPGVRTESLFQISRRNGMDDDDSDIDLHEMPGSYRVASAAGLARLAPNGLMVQGGHVDVSCLQPSLVRMLNSIERHFGRRVIVTSGFRSPEHNRRARGARNSLHMYCAAADIRVEGVTKWQVAEYVRAMPGRGGVGTYCHTDSVHVDVGPERDWNWRCRRRN